MFHIVSTRRGPRCDGLVAWGCGGGEDEAVVVCEHEFVAQLEDLVADVDVQDEDDHDDDPATVSQYKSLRLCSKERKHTISARSRI
jgi:hypothetical protein